MPVVRSSRAVAVSLVLGLLVASCAPDPSSTQPTSSEEPAAEAASDGGAAAAATVDESTDTAVPEQEPVPDDEVAPSSEAAPAVPPSAGRTVTWLDTEFRLPAPWGLLAVDGSSVHLEHPTAAGPGGGVYVSMLARDEQLPAAQRAAIPFRAAGGGTLPTAELDAVFAAGGPGLQVGAPTDQVVTVYSDTGIQVDISREEGALTEAAVATVLALLATIEPPTVTPTTERVAPPAAERAAPAAAPEPSVPSLPRRRVAFGPPYPADPPVAIDPALRLVRVQDRPLPGDVCYVNDVRYACDDPAYRAASGDGFFSMPKRAWLYLLPSVDAIEPACTSLLARALAAGGTFSTYLPAERQCIIQTAHGARIAYIHIYLPDGSLLEARSRYDDPEGRSLGACGQPCPTLDVELKFP